MVKAQDALSGRFGAVWNKAPFTTSRNSAAWKNRAPFTISRKSVARTRHVCTVTRKMLMFCVRSLPSFSCLFEDVQSLYWHSKPTVKFGDCNILQCYAMAMLLSVDSCQPNVSKDATPQCPKMSKGRLLSWDPQVLQVSSAKPFFCPTWLKHRSGRCRGLCRSHWTCGCLSQTETKSAQLRLSSNVPSGKLT